MINQVFVSVTGWLLLLTQLHNKMHPVSFQGKSHLFPPPSPSETLPWKGWLSHWTTTLARKWHLPNDWLPKHCEKRSWSGGEETLTTIVFAEMAIWRESNVNARSIDKQASSCHSGAPSDANWSLLLGDAIWICESVCVKLVHTSKFTSPFS